MTTVLTSPTELQEFLNDATKVSAEAEAGTLQDTLKNAAALIQAHDSTINEQRDIEIQRGVAKFLADNKVDPDKAPVDLTPGKHVGNTRRMTIQNNGQSLEVYRPYSKRAPGVALNEAYADLEEFFQATYHKQTDPALLAKREAAEKLSNNASSVVPADGGFLIPEVMRDELLTVALESAVIRPRATVIPMDSLRLPIPAVDATTNNGSIYGGITAYWSEESALLTPSQASFARVVLEAKKLTTYADVPNELINDAPAFGRFIDGAFPKAISWFEDLAFFTGNGVGQPLGWVNCPASVLYDAAVSSQVAWSDVAGMYARMLPSSLGSAVWLASPDVFPQLAAMTFGTGQFPALITVGGGGGSFGLSLLGRPVIITEKNPALGSNGALSFVDLSYYLIGDRQVMQAASSVDYKFQNDQTSFRIIERVDGRPWLNSAITPANGSSNTLSPFVSLSGAHT